MVDNATKSAGFHRPLDRAAVMVCAVLLVLAAPLALWLLAAFVAPAWPPVRTNRSDPNCASVTVHELAAIGNLSLDPCDDYSHYACFDHELLASRDVRRDEFFKAVVNPTLQGTLRSRASVLLSQLYTSCMKRMANNPVTPESASIALLESVRLWGIGENGSINVASILATMDLRYNMKVGMQPHITMLDPAAKRAFLTMKGLHTRDAYVTGVDNEIFRHRSLLALSGALGHNITAEHVGGLINEVNRQAAGKEGTKRGNYSLLAEIYRTPLLDAMMRKLCDCNEYLSIEVQRADAIIAQLEVFNRHQLRPTALAYLSLWASVQLIGRELNATYAGGHGAEHSTTEKMRYCAEDIMRYSHVWDIIAVEKLRTEEKDRSLRTLYRTVLAAVLAEIGDMFAHTATSLFEVVSGLRLLLPAEVVEPYTRILPSHGEPHIASALALREFRIRAKVLDSSRDLLEAWSHQQQLFYKHVRVTSRFVLIAPTVYSELRLECGTEALYLNAHLVGVHLVDSLVQRLCLRGESEGHAQVVPEAALGHLCDEDPRRLTDVLYPQLALRVVSRALKTGESWHRSAFTWGSWKLSKSQLFYELFYVREVCSHAARLPRTQLQQSAQLMMATEDFRRAFSCPSFTGRRVPVGLALR